MGDLHELVFFFFQEKGYEVYRNYAPFPNQRIWVVSGGYSLPFFFREKQKVAIDDIILDAHSPSFFKDLMEVVKVWEKVWEKE